MLRPQTLAAFVAVVAAAPLPALAQATWRPVLASGPAVPVDRQAPPAPSPQLQRAPEIARVAFREPARTARPAPPASDALEEVPVPQRPEWTSDEGLSFSGGKFAYKSRF